MSQAFFGVPKLISHVGDIAAAEILEFTSLEQIPHALLGIEFGCIPRQTFHNFSKYREIVCPSGKIVAAHGVLSCHLLRPKRSGGSRKA
jgi:hypothetical protein